MSEPPKYATELIAVKAERDALKIACAERDQEIARLKGQLDSKSEELKIRRLWVQQRDQEIERLKAEVKGWSDANAAQAPVHVRVVTELQAARQRISRLEALLERVPHVIFNSSGKWVQHSPEMVYDHCPRCAFEKLKEGK